MTQSSGLRRLAPWLVASLVSLVGVLLALFGFPEGEFDLLFAFTGLAFLTAIVTISFLGAFLRARAPDNAIGWLFIVTGIGMVAASSLGNGLANPAEPTVLEYLGLMVGTAGALLMFYPFILMLYIFPTGRFLSRGWSWTGWYGRIVIPLALVLDTFVESWTVIDSDEMSWTVENPIGFIPTELYDVLGNPVFPILAMIAVGGIAAAVVRYRRANLVERTQLRWLLSAGVWFAITLVLVTTGALGSEDLFSVVLVTAFLPLPIALTFAITRHRLFEIDRIISRTVSYVLVLGLLALVFVAGAIWLPATLLGDSEPIFVAGTTLAAAALFNPLRRRIQRVVDRRFNRSAYEAETMAEDFANRLQSSLTIEELAGQWLDTVESALEPQSVGLWLPDPRSPG